MECSTWCIFIYIYMFVRITIIHNIKGYCKWWETSFWWARPSNKDIEFVWSCCHFSPACTPGLHQYVMWMSVCFICIPLVNAQQHAHITHAKVFVGDSFLILLCMFLITNCTRIALKQPYGKKNYGTPWSIQNYCKKKNYSWPLSYF